jgi:hypothetical protein
MVPARETRRTITVFTFAQITKPVSSYLVSMKIKELTLKQLNSIPCPTCGVPAGKRCVLYSGALRSSSHVDRRLYATDVQNKTSS